MQIDAIIRKYKLYKILDSDFNGEVDPSFKRLDILYDLFTNIYKVEHSIYDEYFSKYTNNLIFTHNVNDISIESDIYYTNNIGDVGTFCLLVKAVIIDIYNFNIRNIFINYEDR